MFLYERCFVFENFVLCPSIYTLQYIYVFWKFRKLFVMLHYIYAYIYWRTPVANGDLGEHRLPAPRACLGCSRTIADVRVIVCIDPRRSNLKIALFFLPTNLIQIIFLHADLSHTGVYDLPDPSDLLFMI